MMHVLAIYILPNLTVKMKRKHLEIQQKQRLLWAQVSELTFIYLLKLASTPYCHELALALKLMH